MNRGLEVNSFQSDKNSAKSTAERGDPGQGWVGKPGIQQGIVESMMELEQKWGLEIVTLWKRRQNPWTGLVFKVRLKNHQTQDSGREL